MKYMNLKNTSRLFLSIIVLWLVALVSLDTFAETVDDEPYIPFVYNEAETQEDDDDGGLGVLAPDSERLSPEGEGSLGPDLSSDSESGSQVEREADPEFCAHVADAFEGCDDDCDAILATFDQDLLADCVNIMPFSAWSGNIANWAALRTQVNTAGRTEINITNTNTISLTNNAAGNHIVIPEGRNITIRGVGATPVTFSSAAGGGWYRRHFHVETGATLTLENVILDGTLTVHTPAQTYRGGISVAPGGNVILGDGAVITRAQGPVGGGVHMWGNGGGLTMLDGSAIRNSHAHNRGGGVYFYGVGRTLTMNGGEITGNTATHGGAILARAGATIIMNDGEISGNSTRGNGNGGAIYIYNANATLTMNGGEIYNNEATGSGIGGNGGGIFVRTGATVNINNDAAIIDNNAHNGAGVFARDGATTINMNNGYVAENIARQYGGGFTVQYNATMHMHDGLIEDNEARWRGAGLNVALGGAFHMHGGTIYDNRVTELSGGAGGGVFVAFMSGANHPIFNMHEGAVIEENQANFGGGVDAGLDSRVSIAGEISDNTAGINGGGIMLYRNTIVHMQPSASILDNEAGSDGGGAFIGDGAALHMHGGQINDNEAGRDGGGLHLDHGALHLVGDENKEISDNTASRNGGGINWPNGSINTETNTGEVNIIGNDTVFNGGGIRMTTGPLTIDDNWTIANNTAGSFGGGIFNQGSTLNMIGGMIGGTALSDANTATTGGGVYVVDDALFNLSGGTIANNIATGTQNHQGGGGVYVSRTSSFYMTAGEIKHNRASRGGGVTVWQTATFTLSGEGLIYDNLATGSSASGIGGGVQNQGRFYMNGGNIDSNRAQNNNGGGVHLGEHSRMFMTAGTITGNTTTHGGGGVNNSSNSRFYLSAGTIEGNTATGVGGGVYVRGNGALIMSDGHIYNNTASAGGGVQIGSSTSRVYFDGGTIGHVNPEYGNEARTNGGGINLPAGTLSIRGTDPKNILGNTAASQHGGGINWTGGTINTANNTGAVNMMDNTAYQNGGGIRMALGTLTATNDWTISGNTAGNNGGGAWIDNGHLTMTGGLIDNNTAYAAVTSTDINRGGGGVFVTDAGQFTATAGAITNNRAPNGDGGGIFTWRHDYNYFLSNNAYNNVNLTTAVIFSGNVAVDTFLDGPGNPEVIQSWIPVNTQSSHTGEHVLNNDDINYRSTLTEFAFVKTDNAATPQSGTRLEGATFRIYACLEDDECTEFRSEATSDLLGNVVLNNLVPGMRHRLVEVEAPSGFITPVEGHYWVVDVDEDGAITVVRAQNAPGFALSDGTYYVGNERLSTPITGLEDRTIDLILLVVSLLGLVTCVSLYVYQRKKRSRYS